MVDSTAGDRRIVGAAEAASTIFPRYQSGLTGAARRRGGERTDARSVSQRLYKHSTPTLQCLWSRVWSWSISRGEFAGAAAAAPTFLGSPGSTHHADRLLPLHSFVVHPRCLVAYFVLGCVVYHHYEPLRPSLRTSSCGLIIVFQGGIQIVRKTAIVRPS